MSAKSNGSSSSTISNLGPPAAVAAGFLGLWYLMSEVVLSEKQSDIMLPPPHAVIESGFLDSGHLQTLTEGLLASIASTLIGLAISMVLGMAIAIAMNRLKWFESTFFPYAIIIQATPIIAVVPLIGAWMGFSFSARILVVVIISLFPIITNTLFGLKSVDRNQIDLFRLHGASGRTRLFKLLLPAATPSIFTGFRISAGLAVVGAIVGEYFFKGGEVVGLGRLISKYQLTLQPKLLIAAIILASLLGVALFLVTGFLSNRLTRSWYSEEKGSR